MPTQKKSTVGKSAKMATHSEKRTASEQSAEPQRAARSRKKGGGRAVAVLVKRTSAAKASSPPTGKAPRGGSRMTDRLWAYIKKNGPAARGAQRPIFDTPVQLRHLEAADIARMLSSATVQLS